MKTIVLLFAFLPVTLIAQTPETQALERLEETQEVERIDPLDGAAREFEEARAQSAPIEVRCECVCPQSQNAPVPGNVRRETAPMEQEREEAQEEQQDNQKTTSPPGQNDSQYVDPVEQQMKRNQ